ncbi:MAG: site-specific integrase [Sulfuricaulis sp.]
MRNNGFGKTLKFAGRCVIDHVYGAGKYGTKRTHKQRWQLIAGYLKESMGIRDLGDIRLEHRQEHADYLAARIAHGSLRIVTAQNILSTFNIVMRGYLNNESLKLSPASIVGRRSQVRRTVPAGMERADVQAAAGELVAAGHEVFGYLLIIVRELALRVREAVLQDYVRLNASVTAAKTVRIIEGSKGGTARHTLRAVPVTGEAQAVIKILAARQGDRRNLIPPGQTLKQYLGKFHYQWDKVRKKYGLGRLHDLRAARACDWYLEETGCPAPVFGAGAAARPADQRARAIISPRLGHQRRSVASSYVGGAR